MSSRSWLGKTSSSRAIRPCIPSNSTFRDNAQILIASNRRPEVTPAFQYLYLGSNFDFQMESKCLLGLFDLPRHRHPTFARYRDEFRSYSVTFEAHDPAVCCACLFHRLCERPNLNRPRFFKRDGRLVVGIEFEHAPAC